MDPYPAADLFYCMGVFLRIVFIRKKPGDGRWKVEDGRWKVEGGSKKLKMADS